MKAFIFMLSLQQTNSDQISWSCLSIEGFNRCGRNGKAWGLWDDTVVPGLSFQVWLVSGIQDGIVQARSFQISIETKTSIVQSGRVVIHSLFSLQESTARKAKRVWSTVPAVPAAQLFPPQSRWPRWPTRPGHLNRKSTAQGLFGAGWTRISIFETYSYCICAITLYCFILLLLFHI